MIGYFSREMLMVGTFLLAVPALSADKPPAKAERPSAETASVKKTERTLAEMIELVLKEGRDKTIHEDIAKGLGFDGKLAVKLMKYKSSVSPDQREHAFMVAYSSGTDGKLEPRNLVWHVTKVTKKEASRFVEGWGFRLSIKGNLERAEWTEGEVGVEVSQIAKSPEAEDVKKAFAKEKAFFLVESVMLPMSK